MISLGSITGSPPPGVTCSRHTAGLADPARLPLRLLSHGRHAHRRHCHPLLPARIPELKLTDHAAAALVLDLPAVTRRPAEPGRAYWRAPCSPRSSSPK